ncbi:hypothetical protein ABIA38_003364 [Embleya sp. AB8]
MVGAETPSAPRCLPDHHGRAAGPGDTPVVAPRHRCHRAVTRSQEGTTTTPTELSNTPDNTASSLVTAITGRPEERCYNTPAGRRPNRLPHPRPGNTPLTSRTLSVLEFARPARERTGTPLRGARRVEERVETAVAPDRSPGERTRHAAVFAKPASALLPGDYLRVHRRAPETARSVDEGFCRVHWTAILEGAARPWNASWRNRAGRAPGRRRLLRQPDITRSSSVVGTSCHRRRSSPTVATSSHRLAGRTYSRNTAEPAACPRPSRTRSGRRRCRYPTGTLSAGIVGRSGSSTATPPAPARRRPPRPPHRHNGPRRPRARHGPGAPGRRPGPRRPRPASGRAARPRAGSGDEAEGAPNRRLVGGLGPIDEHGWRSGAEKGGGRRR